MHPDERHRGSVAAGWMRGDHGRLRSFQEGCRIWNEIGLRGSRVSDQRIETLELDLAEQKRLNANFRAVYEAVEKEKKEVRGELGRKQTEYGKLERAMNRLFDDLQQKAGGNQKLQAEIASLRGQLDTLKSGDGQAVAAKQVQLDQLKGRVQQLEQELGF